MNNPGVPVTIYHVAGFVREALIKAAIPVNIIASFEKPGIYLFSRSVFQDADYIMSTVTEQLDPNERANNPNGSENLRETVTTSASKTSLTVIATAITNTNDSFISPSDFKSYPKVQPKQNTRKPRRKGKCMIVTDSPEKNEIQERETQQIEKKQKSEKRKRQRKTLKTFGLKDTAGKGLFPQLFNTVENQYYIGLIPYARYYSPETMRPHECEQFLEWYEDMVRKNIEFDFQREIVSYCRNDVDILRRACLAFRKIFLDRGKVCPFEECTTIASTCMKVFRKNFLREKEIGIIPLGEYRVNRDSLLSTTVKRNMIDLQYECTRVTTSRLQKLGHIIMEKWECVFDRELQDNQPMRDFLANNSMLETELLDPREAFFGDCTGNIVTRYDVTGTEKIRYVDVWSLYPFVLKTGSFPLGHPDMYVGEECSALIGIAPGFDFSRVEEVVRCKVLAPRDFFYPIFPFRVRRKLLFALCRSCNETFSQFPCTHDTPANREFEGTWVSCELRKAIEKGYIVRSVSEIWKYKISQYGPSTRLEVCSQDISTAFCNLSRSGWPTECTGDEKAKERYLQEYEKTEDIVFDRNNIAINSGLRSVAKLYLNSFWSKFGQ
ncbi:uncharacterized protein LOC112589827 [Harpegnathos saltator]|uniref:uncharacterized protein LOC112589827 n=1 Tax=Harpegnathos saltator TaxID=610380 RepID=UPI000DBED879|nr:uncharacterized protein LOC112589827 [Harpegnathos saltator]